MTFKSNDKGGWVAPLADLNAAQLLAMLPARLQGHTSVQAFVEACVDSAEFWAHVAGDAGKTTLGDVKATLVGAEDAARRMRSALHPFRHGSDAFSTLEPAFEYLALRAREGSVEDERRPRIPALPHDVPPKLSDLLRRIEQDLSSLETVCAHTASEIDPPTSPVKFHERGLVRALVNHHLQYFERLPPVRGWFGDRFVKRIAECAGMSIGWRLVSEEINGASHPIPP